MSRKVKLDPADLSENDHQKTEFMMMFRNTDKSNPRSYD